MAKARPVKFSEAIGKRLCEAISAGVSLRQVCAEPWAPDRHTVREWAVRDLQFREEYELARSFWADALAEDMLELGDAAPGVAAAAGDGQNANAMVQALRIQLDNRRWLLSHWAPKRYADKISTEITGAGGAPLVPAEVDPTKAALAMLTLIRAAAEAQKKAKDEPESIEATRSADRTPSTVLIEAAERGGAASVVRFAPPEVALAHRRLPRRL